MDYKKKFGQCGENLAVNFLLENNFSIIEQNFRYKKVGEIDIIAIKNNLLIFVEVKNRSTDRFGGALYSINKKKQRTIRFVANQFLNLNKLLYKKEIQCRFDMIAVKNNEVLWIKDMFR